MIGQVEVIRKKLQTITHLLMVHARVSDEYINFVLIYTTHPIFLDLTIKYLVNQDCEPTMPHKLETGTKPSLSNLLFLFCQCIVQKGTAHVNRKSLNMCHKSQKCFGVSLLELQNTKRVPHMGTYYMKESVLI